MATTLILKNTTPAVVVLPGTGMQLPASGQDDYTGLTAAILKIAPSKGVRGLVNAGTVVVNDGVADLNKLDAAGLLDALWSSSAQQMVGLLPRGYISGARLSYITVQSVRVGEPGVVSTVVDSNGNFPIVWTGDHVANMAVVGPGGLQTGQVEAPNTWYQVLVIADSNGVNPVDVLLVPAGVAFNEPGYDLFRRVGWVRNNNVSNILKFFQVGDGNVRVMAYDADALVTAVLLFGSAVVFTDIDCSTVVPPNGRRKVTVEIVFDNSGGAGADVLMIRPKGSAATSPLYQLAPGILLSSGMIVNLDTLTDPTQVIQYKVTQVADIVHMFMVSYEDEI